MNIVTTKNLKKIYKKNIVALKDVSINVKKDSITGIIGENGAGKSSLINILVSLIDKDNGEVNILGRKLSEENLFEIKKEIGFVGDKIDIFEHLSILEYWKFVSKIYRIDSHIIDKKISQLLDILDLSGDSTKLIRELSKGMKKKVFLGSALIHEPKLLILDEPLDGIDPTSQIIIKNVLKAMKKKGTSIIICSHDLSLVDEICTDVIIIDRGKTFFNDSVENLYKNFNTLSLEEIFIKITNKYDKIKKSIYWGEDND